MSSEIRSEGNIFHSINFVNETSDQIPYNFFP